MRDINELKLFILEEEQKSSMSILNKIAESEFYIFSESAIDTIIDTIRKILKEFISFCNKLKDEASIKLLEDLSEGTVSKARAFMKVNRRIALETVSVFSTMKANKLCREAINKLQTCYDKSVAKDDYDLSELDDIYDDLMKDIELSKQSNELDIKFPNAISMLEIAGRDLKRDISYWKDNTQRLLDIVDATKVNEDDEPEKYRMLLKLERVSINIANHCIKLNIHGIRNKVSNINKAIGEYNSD